jgi:hypothetical protein
MDEQRLTHERLAEVRQQVDLLVAWEAATYGWRPATLAKDQLSRLASAVRDLLADRDRLAGEVDRLKQEAAARPAPPKRTTRVRPPR